MIKAIRTGNLNQVCLLLDEGISPDVTDEKDVPALIVAASEGHPEIVEVLLAAGATWDSAIVQDSVTVPSEEWGIDRTVGAVTVWAAAKAGHVEVIQVLYEVMPQWVGAVLTKVCELGKLSMLKTLTDGLDMPNYRTYRGPLQVSIRSQQLAVVKHLVQSGLDINFRDELGDGETPLELAAMLGHLDIAKYLAQAGAIVDRWLDGDMPLVSAAYAGQIEVYQSLYPFASDEICQYAEEVLSKTLKRQKRERKTNVEIFIEGAKDGQIEVVQWGISKNLEINAIGSCGQTALMYAAAYGLSTIVDMLIEAGADPDIQSDEESFHAGSTALMKVARSYTCFFAENAHTLIQRLVAAGADINLQDQTGRTALIHAVDWPYPQPNFNTVQTLIDVGADLSIKDNEGYTALVCAQRRTTENIVFAPVLDILTTADAIDHR